jgi:Zn-dependent peptidase ImmA (M78 family)/DNA-binding XRE family transcriptional regulator
LLSVANPIDLSTLSTNLRRLRADRKLNQTQVAEAAGLSRMGYLNIENGEVAPRVDSLMRIAGALDVKLEELLTPVRALHSVRFRAQKKMTSREDLLVKVARWLDDYKELEAIVEDTPAYAFAPLAEELERLPRKKRSTEGAALARTAVGLKPEALIGDICGLLEDHGVKVFTQELASEGFFGLSIAEPDGRRAIVVNTWDRISVERWIFTAVHELAHLLFHHSAFDVAQTDEDADQEHEADLFASHFLVPEERFHEEWQKACGLGFVERVLTVKRIFRVSWKTVVYRVAATSPEPSKVWAHFYGDYKRRFDKPLRAVEEPGGLAKEDFHSVRPAARAADEPDHLLPRDFVEDRRARLVRKAIEGELISLGRGAEILGLDLKEMRRLVVSWRA